MLSVLGNVLNILGLLVTVVAYSVEHRERQLGHLFPGLVKAWRRTVAWLRKVTRRRRNIIIEARAAAVVANVAMSADAMVLQGLWPMTPWRSGSTR